MRGQLEIHTIASLLADAKARGIGESDAFWLLSALLGKSRSELLLDRQQSVHIRFAKKYRAWTRARAGGKPMQYIAGFADFFGREFHVDSGVLIPRPETESLVELALAEGDRLEKVLGRKLRVADIGTGSGAIAITLKLERPQWEIFASDVSGAALTVARANARKLSAKVIFRKGDLFAAWGMGTRAPRFDLVVANLPYVWRGKEKVERQVAAYEPALALFPRRNSLSRMRNAGAHLAERMLLDCLENPRGIRAIVLELSATVAYDLERRFVKDPRIASLARISDLAGRRRFLKLLLEA